MSNREPYNVYFGGQTIHPGESYRSMGECLPVPFKPLSLRVHGCNKSTILTEFSYGYSTPILEGGERNLWVYWCPEGIELEAKTIDSFSNFYLIMRNDGKRAVAPLIRVSGVILDPFYERKDNDIRYD